MKTMASGPLRWQEDDLALEKDEQEVKPTESVMAVM